MFEVCAGLGEQFSGDGIGMERERAGRERGGS